MMALSVFFCCTTLFCFFLAAATICYFFNKRYIMIILIIYGTINVNCLSPSIIFFGTYGAGGYVYKNVFTINICFNILYLMYDIIFLLHIYISK